MPFNFHFTVEQILWTLTFAAILVLLVVLLGRDRMRRFPFFSLSVALVGLNMLAEKLLAQRIAPIVATTIFLVLADLGVLIALLVAIELARKAFCGAKRPAWVVGSVVLLGGAAAVIFFWGKWPPAKMMFDPSTLGHLRLMQLFEEKGDVFNDVLAVGLFALVVIAGRRFKAGWRSHAQQILAGLSVNSATLLIEQVIWQKTIQNMPRTREAYNHVLDLQGHLQNAGSMVALVVMLWWIVCLWIDEPKTTSLSAGGKASADVAVNTLEKWLEKPSDTGANAEKPPYSGAAGASSTHAGEPSDTGVAEPSGTDAEKPSDTGAAGSSGAYAGEPSNTNAASSSGTNAEKPPDTGPAGPSSTDTTPGA
jgi:hypothetical protein